MNKSNTMDTQDLTKLVEQLVSEVRVDLVRIYALDVDDKVPDFTGFCYDSITRLDEKVEQYAVENHVEIECIMIHGEQSHSPICPSKLWHIEHTWSKVVSGKNEVYADPTCSQFKFLYPDIPDYYVSTAPPLWFLDDRKNIAFNGITKRINNSIEIPLTIYDNHVPRVVHDGIIEYCQYNIWGRVSDFIRTHIYHLP